MDSYAHTETTLQDRIDAHEKYARYEINDWIKKQVKLQAGESVLDIGCGNGKQALMYAKEVIPGGHVIGLDISLNLLMDAEQKAHDSNLTNIIFEQDNANNTLLFFNNAFDLVSCCFAIYYLDDIQKTVREIKRVLRSGGRLFVAAPTQNNAIEMRRLVEDATGVSMRNDAYTKRTSDVIIPLIEREFKNMNISIFRNPMNFPTTDAFMDYFKSALISKDIPLACLPQIAAVVDVSVRTIGFFQVTKEVYGILGYK